MKTTIMATVKERKSNVISYRYNTRSKLHTTKSKVFGVHYIPDDQVLVSCKKSRNRKAHRAELSNDIIFKILLFLPAKVLYDVMRNVCSAWSLIVHEPAFASEHLRLAPRGVLIHNQKDGCGALSVERSSNRLEVTKLRFPFCVDVANSCNGLVLLQERSNAMHHVVNLITKTKVALPLFPDEEHVRSFGTLVYASHGQYKVVNVSTKSLVEPQLIICTVGVDNAWRTIDLEVLHICADGKSPLIHRARSVSGFVYWIAPLFDFGLALDADAERMYKFPTPTECRNDEILRSTVDMGTTIGLAEYCCEGNFECSWKLWKLTDLKFGKWTKVFDIDVRALCDLQGDMKLRIDGYWRPIILLENKGELWISASSSSGLKCTYNLICYDFKSAQLLSFEFGLGFQHISSRQQLALMQ